MSIPMTTGVLRRTSRQQALQKLAARKSWRQLLEVVPDSELLSRAKQQAQQAGRPFPAYIDDSATHFMVQKADPSRNLPERVLGGIRLDSANQVHKSYMDDAVKGMGLGPKMYKDVAKAVGGRILADNTQTRDSFGTWLSMARKSTQDALASAPNRPVVIPAGAGYQSSGPFMRADRSEPNWVLRMPSKSVSRPSASPDPTLSQLWPTSSPSGTNYALQGEPFAQGGSLSGWSAIPGRLRRTQLGQPDFPAPNPRSTFAEFARRNLPRPADTGSAPLANQRELLREGMRRRFAQSGKTYDEGIKELQQKLRDRQPSQERPQVLRPAFGNPSAEQPTGYTVRPFDDIRKDPRDLAGRPAPRPPTPLPPPGTSMFGNSGMFGTASPGALGSFGGGPLPSQSPAVAASVPVSPGSQAFGSFLGGPFRVLNPPPPRAQSPSTQRTVDDWFSRGQPAAPTPAAPPSVFASLGNRLWGRR